MARSSRTRGSARGGRRAGGLALAALAILAARPALAQRAVRAMDPDDAADAEAALAADSDAPPPAPVYTPPPPPIEAPDVALAFSGSLERVFAGWPGLSALRGPAYVEVLLVAGPGGADRWLRVWSPDATAAGVTLGGLSLELVTYAGAEESDVSLELVGPLAARARADGRLPVTVALADGTVTWTPGPMLLALQVEGLALERLLPNTPMQGRLDARVDLGGATDAPAGSVTLDATEVRWRAERVGAVAFVADLADAVLHATLRWRDGERTVATLTAELPLELDLHAAKSRWLDERPHTLSVDAPALTPADLAPWWRAPGGVDFSLVFSARSGGTLDALASEARLSGPLRVGALPPLPLEATLTVGAAEQALRASLGGEALALELATRLPLVSARRAGTRLERAPVEGRLRAALELATLAPFVAAGLDKPAGALRADVALAGTLGAPEVSGGLSCEHGAVTLVALSQRLTDLTLEAKLDGTRLQLVELSADAGRGAISTTGELGWEGTPAGGAPGGLWSAWRLRAALQTQLAGFPVLLEGFPVGAADGNIETTLELGPGETLARVAVHAAELRLSETTLPRPTPVAAHPAVRVVDWLGRKRPPDRWLAGDGHLALEVTLVEPLRVRGEASDVDLEGTLKLDRKGPLARVEGGFRPRPGGYFPLLGNRFEVRSGLATLLGGNVEAAEAITLDAAGRGVTAGNPDEAPHALPLEPLIDFAAEGMVERTQVAVLVRGPLRRPELVLVSNPPLPEFQLLTLLILGRVDAVDERDGEVRRRAAELVERFHNPGLKRQLFDRIGVDNLGLGFGSSVAQPVLTVGKQVNRTLYLETVYRHNAPPDQNEKEGHVEYRVAPRWTLDTVFGDAAEGSVGVFWHTSFGGPPPPERVDLFAIGSIVPTDSDADGISDSRDRCPVEAEDADGFEDEDGCPDADDDGDGVPDGRDVARRLPEAVNGYRDGDGAPDTPPEAWTLLRGRVVTLPFDANSRETPPETGDIVRALAEALRGVAAVRVAVEGHSDDLGSPEGNRRMSEQRALAVRDVLVGAGIADGVVDVLPRGFDRPLDPAATDEARARNRRVEVEIVALPPEPAPGAPEGPPVRRSPDGILAPSPDAPPPPPR